MNIRSKDVTKIEVFIGKPKIKGSITEPRKKTMCAGRTECPL